MSKKFEEIKEYDEGVDRADCLLNEDRLQKLKDGGAMLTDQQKRAVLEKGKILVSAAAGSGKTATMVKRIMLMIGEGLSIKNILVLVYNTAAADELKDRLYAELFDRACSESGKERERYRRELDNLPFCHISTIHSFCAALLRENFDKAGLSPTFDVLDESAHAVYKNNALNAVFADYAEKNDEEFLDVAEIFAQARKEDNLKANILKIHSLLDVQHDRNEFLKRVENCFSSFKDSEYMRVLEKYYKDFFGDAELALEEDRELLLASGVAKHIEAFGIADGIIKSMLSAPDFYGICKIASSAEKPEFGRKSKKMSDETKRVMDTVKEVIEDVYSEISALSDIYNQFGFFEKAHAQNAGYVRKIIEITERFDSELKRLKDDDGVLSFEDLQHRAVELLDGHPELGDSFDAVFVDEYQDVNPTQERIIRSLIRNDCFMVGDVKQSIYGFRLADPTIFLARRKEYDEGGGISIDFNKNFRSSKEILGFVNDVFDVVMTDKSADVDYKNTAAFDLKGSPSFGPVQVHLFTNKKADRKIAEGLYDITQHVQEDEGVKASVYEGRFIASEIKSLVGRALGDGKYIGYGDIAVLFRSRRDGARRIVEQLKLEGIPVDESVFGNTDRRPEGELISLLRVIDNPRQDVPLAGFLLSFFGGLNENELAKIAAEEGECLYDKVQFFIQKYAQDCEIKAQDGDSEFRELAARTALAARLKDLFKTVSDLRIRASFKSVGELMSSIVSDFGYDAYLMSFGEAEVYALKSFISTAGSRDGESLGKFLEEYLELEASTAPSGGGDRVKISTFHSFKGLEIPVVFVADAGAAFKSDAGTSDLTAAGSGYIGLSYFDFETRRKNNNTLSKIAVSKIAKQIRLKEEMRLFYVALTRAKQLMYVTASITDRKYSLLDIDRRIGGAGCDLDFIYEAKMKGKLNAAIFPPQDRGEDRIFGSSPAKRMLPSSKELVEDILKEQKRGYAYAQSTQMSMKYSVSALVNKDEPLPEIFSESDGASVGTAYHKVMQFIDFFATDGDAVRAELLRLKDEGILSEDEYSRIDEDVILRCLTSEIMGCARDALLSGRCLREQRFMMYRPASDISSEFPSSDKVLVQGVVDLFIMGEKNILVDFKFSGLSDEKLAEKYEKQLHLYKTAIEGAVCGKVDRTVLYSFKSGNTIEC